MWQPLAILACFVEFLGFVVQDLVIHCDGIHSKLVSIMKERLLLSIRQLSDSAQQWPKKDGIAEASSVVQQIGKQVIMETGGGGGGTRIWQKSIAVYHIQHFLHGFWAPSRPQLIMEMEFLLISCGTPVTNQ